MNKNVFSRNNFRGGGSAGGFGCSPAVDMPLATGPKRMATGRVGLGGGGGGRSVVGGGGGGCGGCGGWLRLGGGGGSHYIAWVAGWSFLP